eukprot:scaffold351661_cov26-Prasinocladus_malaysianus.AAC.1
MSLQVLSAFAALTKLSLPSCLSYRNLNRSTSDHHCRRACSMACMGSALLGVQTDGLEVFVRIQTRSYSLTIVDSMFTHKSIASFPPSYGYIATIHYRLIIIPVVDVWLLEQESKLV